MSADAPFRRLIIDTRLDSARLVEEARAVLSETLGTLPNAAHLLVYVTLLRGGGPRWFVSAVDPKTSRDVPGAAVLETIRRLEALE